MTRPTFPVQVRFECNEKRFAFTDPDSLPAEVRRFRDVMKRHNDGYARGWASAADKDAILADVEAVADTLFPFVRLAMNADWLDDPQIVAPLDEPVALAPDDVGYDLTVGGELRIWLSTTVTLPLTVEVDPDAFDEWAQDQHLEDLFLLGLADTIAAEVTAEESIVTRAAE